MPEREFLIHSIRLLDFDGVPHLPTVIYYPTAGRRLIGFQALSRMPRGTRVIEDFKVELGSLDPNAKRSRGRLFFTPAGSPKDAAEVTKDFFFELSEQIRAWLGNSEIGNQKVSVLLAEPVSMQAGLVPEEWLANYRRHLTAILTGYDWVEQVDFMPEPFAAFQYYRHGVRHPLVTEHTKKNVLVIDFGGGTFDVCVIETTREGDISRSGRNAKPLAAASLPVGGFFINRGIADALLAKAATPGRAAEIKKGLQQYWEWRKGKGDITTLDRRYQSFIQNFHDITHQVERLKLALCQQMPHWDLSRDLAFNVPVVLPKDPFAREGSTIELKLSAGDLRKFFVTDVWERRLQPVIEHALRRAAAELSGAPISVVLLSGGSANIGWLRELLRRDFQSSLADAHILQLQDFQEVVAKGLAVECARRFYSREGDFSSVTYNRLCLLLSPDGAGKAVRSFKPRDPELPAVQGMPGVLLPSASVVRSFIDRPMVWKVHLEKAPKKRLDYYFLRSSLDAEDIGSLYNVEEHAVFTPPKAAFDKDVKIELRVSADGTAHPRFVYKSGRGESDSISVAGRPFVLDMTYGRLADKTTAYLGLDFGSSNSAVSFVEEAQVEVYRRRAEQNEWRELGDLVEVLPLPVAIPLGQYLSRCTAPAVLEFVEAALALASYTLYAEFRTDSGRARTRLFKGLTQRSAGPLWAFLKAGLGTKATLQITEPLRLLLREDFSRQLDETVDFLALHKHNKAPAGQLPPSVHQTVCLLANLLQMAFASSRFGFYEGVEKKGFGRVMAGRFRVAHGPGPFFKSWRYEGPTAFSVNEAVAIHYTTDKTLPLGPLFYWDRCKLHADMEIGHCFLFDKAEEDRMHFKAAGLACTQVVSKEHPLFEDLIKLRNEDMPQEWIAGTRCLAVIAEATFS